MTPAGPLRHEVLTAPLIPPCIAYRTMPAVHPLRRGSGQASTSSGRTGSAAVLHPFVLSQSKHERVQLW